MYSTIGKMTALAGAVLTGANRAALEAGLKPVVVDPPAPEPASPSAAALDAIGRDNEAVRNACLDIVQKVRDLSTLGADLDAVFRHVNLVLTDLEQTKSELIQRGAVLAMIQETHEDLKKTHAAIVQENDRNRAELGMLRPESQRLVELARSYETRLEKGEARWTDLRTRLSTTEAELAAEKARAGDLAEELANRRAELGTSDALVSQLQTELGNLSYRVSVAEETARAVQIALTESQQGAARLGAEHEVARAACEMMSQRVVAMESEWAKQQAEHLQTRNMLQQEIEQLRTTGAETQSNYDQLKSLHEISERTLALKLDELQTRTDDLRAEERRTRDALAAAAHADKKVEVERATAAELATHLADVDKNRATLVAQVKPLLKTIEEKTGEIDVLQQNLRSVTERFEQEARKQVGERDRLDAAIKDLTVRLEDEKTRRALAEGALEEDRRARVELQLAVSSAKAPPTSEQRRPPVPPKRRPHAMAGE